MNASIHGLLLCEGVTSICELGLDINTSIHELASKPEFFLSFHNGTRTNQELHTDGPLTFEKSLRKLDRT